MLTSASTPDGLQSGVNAATKRKRRKITENKEYAAFLVRTVRAFGKRVSEGDIDAFPDLLAITQNLDDAANVAVTGLRQFGYSWAEVVDRVGITKQTAQERWGGDRK